MQISESIDLPVGVNEAWEILLRWEDQARWMKDAAWVRVVSDRREGVGTRIRVKTLLYGVPAFVEPMEVVEWAPPHRLVMRHGSLVKGRGTWTLEPAATADAMGERGAGPSTRFTWTEDISLRVPMVGDLAARRYARFMRGLMRGSLEGLRGLVDPPPIE